MFIIRTQEEMFVKWLFEDELTDEEIEEIEREATEQK
jgi:hypothetical protein